jgi:hypothetical protein
MSFDDPTHCDERMKLVSLIPNLGAHPELHVFHVRAVSMWRRKSSEVHRRTVVKAPLLTVGRSLRDIPFGGIV